MGTGSCDWGFHQVIFKIKLFQRVSNLPCEQWRRSWEDETFPENLPSRRKERAPFPRKTCRCCYTSPFGRKPFREYCVWTIYLKHESEKIILKYLRCSNSTVWCVSPELLESLAVSFHYGPAVSLPLFAHCQASHLAFLNVKGAPLQKHKGAT